LISPFERDDARVMALYRIPTPPGTGRALEVSVRAPSVFGEYPWPGGLAVALTIGSLGASRLRHGMAVLGGESLPFSEGSFDMLILHRTLDDLHESAKGRRLLSHISGFLSRASRVLVSGGLVAGCVKNRYSLAHNFRRFGAALGVRNLRHKTPPATRRRFSMSFIRRVLERAGLKDIELFYLFPDDRSPLFLFEGDRSSARPIWIRDLRARRQELGAFRYLAQRLLLELGPKNLGCESIFFWGRKS
jgi:SAM-dependent methyltransferase